MTSDDHLYAISFSSMNRTRLLGIDLERLTHQKSPKRRAMHRSDTIVGPSAT